MNRLKSMAAALNAARKEIGPVRISGRVTHVSADSVRVSGLSRFACLGDLVTLEGARGARRGEVIVLDEDDVVIKPFERTGDIVIGCRAHRTGGLTIHPHESWKGRVINALGRPVDDRGPLIFGPDACLLDKTPPRAMDRNRVEQGVRTGVRVIDLFTPLCVGQRIGIFAGSGVGKSTLLGMLAGFGAFDTVVVCLVGERGREVREFIDETLGPALDRSVVVTATGDESAMMRKLAPKTAMSVAEYFRALGQSVLLIVDSATRFAHATREVAMAAGEPPVSRGYTPSVFSELAQLLERAGPGMKGEGAITAIFSVLVDGDDHNDPVADAMRGQLDGHIVLDRKIAEAGRYPPVDILRSTSRLSHRAWTPEQRELILRLRGLISEYEETKDLRMLGGYQAGGNAALDKACHLVPRLYEAMRQTAASSDRGDPFADLARSLSDGG